MGSDNHLLCCTNDNTRSIDLNWGTEIFEQGNRDAESFRRTWGDSSLILPEVRLI